MSHIEFDSSLRAVLRTADPDVLGLLKVHHDSAQRQVHQRAVIGIINRLTPHLPSLYERFQPLLILLKDQQMNEHWDGKRELGHIQRCVCSGDRYFFEFGLEVLLTVVTGQNVSQAHRVLFWAEGRDTQTAWTVAPLLLAENKSFDEIMNWVATGSTSHDRGVTLAGLRGLPLHFALRLPDRYDQIYRDINPQVPPITTHPNYTVARALAHHLAKSNLV